MFQFTPSCSLVKLSQKNQRCKSPPPASFWQNLGQAVPRVVFICKSCAFAATIVIVGMKMMMMMMRCIAKHSYSNNAPLQPLLSSPALHRPGGFIRHLSTSRPPAPSSRLKIHFKNPPAFSASTVFAMDCLRDPAGDGGASCLSVVLWFVRMYLQQGTRFPLLYFQQKEEIRVQCCAGVLVHPRLKFQERNETQPRATLGNLGQPPSH